jgi:flagellar basal body-associated protein FliL
MLLTIIIIIIIIIIVIIIKAYQIVWLWHSKNVDLRKPIFWSVNQAYFFSLSLSWDHNACL